MAENTAIEWADHTFNPWIGCAKISPACDACYAEALMGTTGRMKRAEWGGPGLGVGTRVRTSEANWAEPRTWNRKAAAEGTSPMVFCASLADVGDKAVPFQWFVDLLILAKDCANLTWLFLTKRISQLRKLVRKAMDLLGWTEWPQNIAVGATVINQAEADRDIPRLLFFKAVFKPAFVFLSMEPLLAPVDLRRIPHPAERGCFLDVLTGEWFFEWSPNGNRRASGAPEADFQVDWVIAGGETNQPRHQSRPMHPDWVRSLRDQCAETGRPFLFKQWGSWVAEDQAPEATEWWENITDYVFPDSTQVWELGKRWTGRLLDGALHDARPAR